MIRGRDVNQGVIVLSRVEDALGWLMRPGVTGGEDPPSEFRDDPLPHELAALERDDLERAA